MRTTDTAPFVVTYASLGQTSLGGDATWIFSTTPGAPVSQSHTRTDDIWAKFQRSPSGEFLETDAKFDATFDANFDAYLSKKYRTRQRELLLD